MMETARKVGEEPVDSYRVDPVIEFLIWVLMKVEVDKVVLVSESVWMNLQRKPCRTTIYISGFSVNSTGILPIFQDEQFCIVTLQSSIRVAELKESN